jgi:hypothetical protein
LCIEQEILWLDVAVCNALAVDVFLRHAHEPRAALHVSSPTHQGREQLVEVKVRQTLIESLIRRCGMICHQTTLRLDIRHSARPASYYSRILSKRSPPSAYSSTMYRPGT